MDVHDTVQLYQHAALVHDNAAEFWDRHGRPDKAAVERERAEANRFYADFEAARLSRYRDDHDSG